MAGSSPARAWWPALCAGVACLAACTNAGSAAGRIPGSTTAPTTQSTPMSVPRTDTRSPDTTNPANGSQGTTGGHGGTVGSFTVAFAQCMRSHGVPAFPDPNGRGNQLGPYSGIDPTSAVFQAALNGPCKSLAPQAWIDNGPG